ncbi:unnamed protein product [Toxocara canis]|nr:unnamed protein product [Toxocara canis]
MQGLGNQEFTLRTSDFNEASVADVMQAMHMLAKHNVMGLGLSLGVPAMAQMRSNEPSNVQHPQSLIQAPRYDSASAMDPDSLMDSADRHYAAHSDINKVTLRVKVCPSTSIVIRSLVFLIEPERVMLLATCRSCCIHP